MAIQIRRGSNAEWETNNSNIVVGEPAVATDSSGQFRIILPLNNTLNISTANEMNTWLAGQNTNGTPVQFSVKLVTPQVVQLSPQQVRTLLGQNNIWADSGEVEVTYRISNVQ